MSHDKGVRRSLRDVIDELIERTNSIIMRMRIVEQRNNNITTKMNSIEETSMEEAKESKAFTKSIESKMKSHDERLLCMENMLKDISKKINNAATKAEIKGIEQTLRLYSPVNSQFVTKSELKKELKTLLNKKQNAK